jgi:hypothetical protein
MRLDGIVLDQLAADNIFVGEMVDPPYEKLRPVVLE